MARNITGKAYAATKYNEFTVKKPALLLDYIMTQLSGMSRNKAKSILSGRGVCVNKKVTTAYDFPLEVGMVVRISKHKRSTELHSKYVRIIYEDKDLIVIDKSAGILSMETTGGQYCVKSILDEYFARRHFKCTAHVVHRLDRETSGLMIYAKNLNTEQILEENWQSIVTDRRYVAVVSGKMEIEGGTVRSWLKDNKAFVTYSSEVDNGGKYAITHYRRLQSTDRCSLVELKLETGRKNQIRVHMKDVGHPVAGDAKYGNGFDPIGRLALHAYRLHFFHPITREKMEFETPYPTAFMYLFTAKKNVENQE